MEKRGKNIKALENLPILSPGLGLYFDAYKELSYDRPVGMSMGPIPWSSIIKWCQLHSIHDINDINTCIRYIRELEKVDRELSDT